MTDYNKITVANLRQLLKERGIPSTGLTKKAQIIQKLQERDQADNNATNEPEAPTAAAAASPEPQNGVEVARREAAQTNVAQELDQPASEQLKELHISTEPIQPESAEASAAGSAPTEKPTSPVRTEPSSELVEETQPAKPQTQITDFAANDHTPSPAPNERPSIEKPELLIPEASANTSVEASRLNSEEVEADTRKRKRRSGSPEIPSHDVQAKKPRPAEDAAPNVHLKEDNDIVMEQRQPEDAAPDVHLKGDSDIVMEQRQPEEGAPGATGAETTNGTSDSEGKKDEKDLESKHVVSPDGSKAGAAEKKEKGDRYKGLFNAAAPAHAADAEPDDRQIGPALHAATPALYIRDFMRPLRLEALRSHLISAGSPPSAPPDASILKALFLDQMKTHAFVCFSTTTAASRVRASMHSSIWPPDSGKRKELWVDFVPEDKALDWIKEEESALTAEKDARAAGRPISVKKFEVVYSKAGDGVQAVFQEVGSGAPENAPRGPKSDLQRSKTEQQRVIFPSQPTDAAARLDQDKNFATLDQLFDSTETKPKLYYLPVSDAIAQRRQDDLHDETSRDWRPEVRGRGRGQSGLDQKLRYSFDDDDRVVEVGEDFGPWAEDRSFRGYRGGRAFGRGGFRSERGGGDRYRGSGGRGGRRG